ncbi:MAG: sugar-binding protein [Melioribacteraceae bacterium]
MKLKSTTLWGLLFFAFFAIIKAQQTSPEQKPAINAERIDSPIELTGKLDNPQWNKAKSFELNYEIRPGDNTQSKQKTTVRILYDNEFLYFGFDCLDDDPKSIRANVSDRDKIYNDDFVIVVFDTYGDYQKSYEFAVNPYGNQGDLLATMDNEDASMDYIWYSAASLNDHGWTAELKIPFKSLAFSEKEEHTWPMHVIRTIPRESRYQVSWMKVDRNIPTFMPQAGLLTGLKNIKSGGNLELLPYVIGQSNGQLTDFDNPSSKFKFDPLKGRIGAGLKYSPSQALSLEAVINPDFSQIESDAEQIEINTTFALNYDEKRPFFLTGNDLLQTPMYYSRSINNPLGAGRVLGKSGNLSYLVLSAYDRNTIVEVPGEERSNLVSTDLKSLATIGRLRYDFGDENYLGLLGLGRNIDDASNYVIGLDWNYKFWSNWYFSGEGFLSKTKELNNTALFGNTRKFGNTNHTAAFDGESYSGDGLHLSLSYNSRAYSFATVFNNFSPTYQTYNGLFGQVNYRQLYMEHEYQFYPTDSFIDSWGISLQGEMQFNFSGIKREQYVMPQLYFTLKGQTNISINYLLVNDERFGNVWFEKINRIIFNINTRPIKELSFYANGQIGNFIYRSSKPEMGEGHNFYAGMTVRPSSKINISFDYSRANLSGKAKENLFYDGNIYRIVGIYQFNSEMYVRVITQYNSFDKSFNLYPLFSYKLNAFTTFYAGATSSYAEYNEIGLKNTAQQYFVKIQYLLGV